MTWTPSVYLDSGGWIWKASDCSSHTRAGECRESWDGWGEPETRRCTWENGHTHTPDQQRSCQDKERSGSRSNHYTEHEFCLIKTFPSILQDKQRPPFPLMTVLWRLKGLADPRNLSSPSAVMKMRTRRVSGAALKPFLLTSALILSSILPVAPV